MVLHGTAFSTHFARQATGPQSNGDDSYIADSFWHRDMLADAQLLLKSVLTAQATTTMLSPTKIVGAAILASTASAGIVSGRDALEWVEPLIGVILLVGTFSVAEADRDHRQMTAVRLTSVVEEAAHHPPSSRRTCVSGRQSAVRSQAFPSAHELTR